MHDVFICHAGEDQDEVARPLAERLTSAGLTVWYAEFSLKLGDSLRESIDQGLADSRFGVVILSPHFFAKKWPQAELNGLFAKEMIGDKTIIPLWHNITQAEVAQYSPILADRLAAPTSRGLDRILEQVLDVVQSGWRHRADKGSAAGLSPTSVRLHSGEWAVQTQVAIVNRGNSPLHAVTLKILIQGDGVTADSLQIEAEPQVPPVEATIGDVIVSADQLRLNCSDMQGRQIVLFVLHTIPARSTRTLSVKGITPVNSTAELSIADFEHAPKELLTRGPNQLAVGIKPPESVRLHGIALKMRRRI